MLRRVETRSVWRLAGLVACGLMLIALGGCTVKHPTSNLVAGKTTAQGFVSTVQADYAKGTA